MPVRRLSQVLQAHEGSISIKELSDITAIKTDDIISTLQHLNLIQYQKGQHVLCAAPSVIDRVLKSAGSPGLEVAFLSSPPRAKRPCMLPSSQSLLHAV
jgi:histone acetyltransferase MYST1